MGGLLLEEGLAGWGWGWSGQGKWVVVGGGEVAGKVG